MSKGIYNLEDIDDYLSGNFSPEEIEYFEKKIEADDELKKDIQLVKTVIAGIQDFGFRQMLKKIHKDSFNEDGSPKATNNSIGPEQF